MLTKLNGWNEANIICYRIFPILVSRPRLVYYFLWLMNPNKETSLYVCVCVYVRACGNELVELKHDGAQSFILLFFLYFLFTVLLLFFFSLLFISLPMTHFMYKFFVWIYYQAVFYDVKMIPKLGFIPTFKIIRQKRLKKTNTIVKKADQHGKKHVAIAWLFV